MVMMRVMMMTMTKTTLMVTKIRETVIPEVEVVSLETHHPVIPLIAEAVGQDLEVLVDGGIRSGLDVVKMLSLGAKACLLGRAWAYAVAGGGEAGVAHVLRIIREEMNVAMALTGKRNLAELGPDVLDR